jgi:bacillopeptidase F
MAWLEGKTTDAQIHQRYWIINAFHLKAKPEIILEVAKRTDVQWVSHNGEVHIVAEPSDRTIPTTRAVEWNVLKIMADSCWNAGFTGQGIILGETDTGVDYTHPAISGKWAGYWHVASGLPPSSTPYDDHNHGTHCMGTILGGDGSGPFSDDIGVAYNATFVAAKVLNSGGSGSYAQCAEGLQFMADLKDSVDIKAVSNSWSGSNAADTFFYPIMRTYISIGILPVFANANNGPNPGTVGCPGSYSNVVGVGATDNSDDIASFSSRGPAPNQSPFNDPSTWLRDDWNLIKPQISAPGVSVRSCIPGGGYATWNGTSMATPHVAGAVGILCQKNPTLTPEMLYTIFLDNVDLPPQGAPYPNNDYGWGRLNVWKALNGTPTVNQPWISVLSRTITDPPPGGNNNGILEPSETGEMEVTIKNIGGEYGYNTTGMLESFDNYVRVTDETYLFGDLAPDQTGSNTGRPFLLHVHDLTPQGHTAKVGLILHADGEHDTLDFDDTLLYSLDIGTAPPAHIIYEDDFEYGGGIDSFPNYWQATGNWHRTDTEYNSPTHCAYSGQLVDGTVTMTLMNPVDLTAFSQAELNFWHAFNFDNGFWTDFWVEVSSNGGSNWNIVLEMPFPSIDTLPWTEETYSITQYISNNFTVRYRLNSRDFFQDFNDWWIDDFKLSAPTDNEPPYFTNTTVWPDTNFIGPFPVQSTVIDESGVDIVYLYYRVNGGSWQQLTMNPQGNDVYLGTIPQQNLDDTIDYYLWARDQWITPKTGADPVGAPSYGYYSFRTSQIGVKERLAQAVCFTPLSPNPTKGFVNLAFTIPNDAKVSCVVYDVIGRKVRTLVNKTIKSGEHKIAWDRKDSQKRAVSSGIYFIKFSIDNAQEYKKIEKFVLIK